MGTSNTGLYYFSAEAGSLITKKMSNNFGATVNAFGYPQMGGNCFVGVYYMDLEYNPTGPGTTFAFLQPAQEVTDLVVSQVYAIKASIVCLTTCPAGQSLVGDICLSCPTACSTCTSATVCTSCTSGNFLRADNLCYATCLTTFFPNSATGTCDSCITGCDVCVNASACTTCSALYFLRSDSVCYTGCQAGTWPNAATHTCSVCTAGCKTCTSATACSVS
jgi:hypothetical protein